MRIFALVGALLLAGGAFLLIDGGLRILRCVDADLFSLEVWTDPFWLRDPSQPAMGLSPNAHWFLRIVGGLLALAIGSTVLRVATR